ncbi:tetratricopeptide repeat protein [candidate division KSB1 bacterium]|nr:tetratricopeptide repeat protein [candidate division KSB1 bacterium]
MKNFKLKFLILALFFISNCAYYNTFFNANMYFNDAEKQREERLKKEKKQRQQGQTQQRNRRAANPNRPSSQELKNYNLSIEKASKVLEIYPKSKYIDDALFLLGKCFFRKLDYQKAERKFIELRENFPNSEFVPESKLWLGKTYIELRDYETAEETFHQTLNTDVEDNIRDEARYLLGGLFKHKKDYVTAISEFETAADRAKDKTIRAQSYYEMGECYFEIKNYEKAVESFKKARKYSPDDKIEYEAMFRAGLTYQLLEQFEEAINIFNDLLGNIVNEENWPACRLETAHCYRLGKDFDTAVDWYLDIIEQHPKSVEAADSYFYLGKIYQENKAEYDFALEYYDKAPLENARAEKANDARAKSKSIKELLELRENIIAQEERIAKGDSMAAVIENLDMDEDEINKSVLKFSRFDTLVATALEFPLDSLPVYEDTLMSIYMVQYKDYDEELMNQLPEQQYRKEFKASFLDTLLAHSLNLPFAYLSDYQDSLKNIYDRYYPTFKQNKLMYELYLNKNKGTDAAVKNEKETPLQALIQAKLSLAEIYLFDFVQPDSAMAEYLDVLEIDTSGAAIPKTLYSLGYIAETFQQDTIYADSMFQRLLTEYPDDPLTQHAKNQIKTIEIQDPELEIAEKYKTAEFAYLDHQNYGEALNIFSSITEDYPDSDFAPRSILASGWIYENELDSLDKAYLTYQSLMEKYPDSPYTAQIKKKVEVVSKAKSAVKDTSSVKQEQTQEIQLAEADTLSQTLTTAELDIASMDKEQYRLYLKTEMEKNDQRRTTARRW